MSDVARMSDIVLRLNARDLDDIKRIARRDCDLVGALGPATVAEMATELLRSHLVLIRDCGGILPAPKRASKPKASAPSRKIIGKNGVSLGAGINAPD